MASSSTSAAAVSCTWKYDVFPSFSGEDVRKTFLSHLLKELNRKLINTFIDNDIERSRPIGPELLLAIRESRISMVIFSMKYASSTWCLDELVAIHKCCDQRVVPVFYEIDPSDVRKQTGDFGEIFKKTCKHKSDDQIQKWIQALKDVASIAGFDSQNRKWSDEAMMIEHISTDVLNKLFPTTTNGFGEFVGIEAHLERLNSVLRLESEEVKMVGIVGPSGIGKTTIVRALFSELSTQFDYRVFKAYKRTIHNDYEMKLAWEEQFLSEILCQKEIKLEKIGEVEQRLKIKKVLIVLDDVEDLELLKTLAGKPEWFGNGSRIIVITQDRQLLKAHDIDLIYEVEFPTEDIALKMLCRSAFGQNSPPDGFMELAVGVAELAGNLPLGLTVLGSSLKGRGIEEWVDMMPILRIDLKGEIGKILKVGYDRLDNKHDQDLFLYVACLFNGESVNHIKNLLEKEVFIGVIARLRMLVDKSLIRITTPDETVQMHNLLQKLGREIVREESINHPGKRRFLLDPKDIRKGTENVLGICLNISDINEPLVIDENSFGGMHNLQFIKLYDERWWPPTTNVKLNSLRGLDYLPPKLRLLHWDKYPGKYLPSSFRGECLVELIMRESKLEKLWKGKHPPLGSLKKMDLWYSYDLKEIPDLSDATNLEISSLKKKDVYSEYLNYFEIRGKLVIFLFV